MTDPVFKHFDFSDDDPKKSDAKTPLHSSAADDFSASAAEVVNSEAFQRKLDEEWTSSRGEYQDRLSTIMDDFLRKNIEREAREPNPEPNPRTRVSRDQIEAAIARMAHEFNAYEANARAAAAATPLALPAPTAKSKLPYILGGIAAALVVIGVYAAWAYRQVGGYTPLPYPRTGAIAVDAGKIYIADWFRKSLYVHAEKRGAPILAVESLPSNLLTGYAPDPDGFWSADGVTSEIVRHSNTSDHRVLERFPAPGDRPAGLVEEKGNLWVTSASEKKLYRLRADDPSEVIDSHDFPDVNVTALQIRDRRLWVLDGKSREIYVFRIQKQLKPLATLDLDPFLRGGTPTGLAIRGRDAWIVTENPAAIVRVPLRKIKKSKESEF